MWLGIRWGIGHSLGLLLVTGVVIVLRDAYHLDQEEVLHSAEASRDTTRDQGWGRDHRALRAQGVMNWAVGAVMLLLGAWGYYTAWKLRRELLASKATSGGVRADGADDSCGGGCRAGGDGSAGADSAGADSAGADAGGDAAGGADGAGVRVATPADGATPDASPRGEADVEMGAPSREVTFREINRELTTGDGNRGVICRDLAPLDLERLGAVDRRSLLAVSPRSPRRCADGLFGPCGCLAGAARQCGARCACARCSCARRAVCGRQRSKQLTASLLALGVGILHGIGGPGGVLAVLPTLLIPGTLGSCLYLGAFCVTATLTMGAVAGLYGACTNRTSRGSASMPWVLTAASASTSVLVGIVWIVASATGTLGRVLHAMGLE